MSGLGVRLMCIWCAFDWNMLRLIPDSVPAEPPMLPGLLGRTPKNGGTNGHFSSKHHKNQGQAEVILVTSTLKTWDECLCVLGFSSLPPLWVLESSSLPPLFFLGTRGGNEVESRQERGGKEHPTSNQICNLRPCLRE